MRDATSVLRTATRRAKSDVANKMVSMFLHELSRSICREWDLRVEGDKYGDMVRLRFGNLCPYCLKDLNQTTSVVEHLDGMNRYRTGLHIPGNVVVSCKKCNGEKRRDDGRKDLVLAESGWASFLSHDGGRCSASCATCLYWTTIWPDEQERTKQLAENIERIRHFRRDFASLEKKMSDFQAILPSTLTKLYSDCQSFAESEINLLLQQFHSI
jgi:hypothetical protein